MIREANIPEGAETVTLDAHVEVYLRHREDPVRLLATFQFQREHLREDAPGDSFLGIVNATVSDALNDRSQPLLYLSDDMGTEVMVETAEVQAVSVHAPETNTILEAME